MLKMHVVRESFNMKREGMDRKILTDRTKTQCTQADHMYKKTNSYKGAELNWLMIGVLFAENN